MVDFARRTTGALMRSVDELFSRGALVRPRGRSLSPAEVIRANERLIAGFPADLGADVEAFFPIVGTGGWGRRVIRQLDEGHVVELRTPSRHTPIFELERSVFESLPRNHVACARHFRHQRRHRRTAVIFVHGFMAGDFLIEELEWPTHAFYERGLDVVLAVLPTHGARRSSRSWESPAWPGKSPTFTIEGFRQAIGELRGLVSHLHDDGVENVAVVGMSLGGFTSALLATVEPRLCLVAPFIPLASTADFLRENGQLHGTAEEVARQHELIEQTFASTSPMTRPCLVPRDGRIVFAGAFDAVTPVAHADRIAAHFEVDTTLFPGAHLMQFGRWQAWRAILRNLGRRGFMPERTTR